ncbi:MAG TPA: nicotinate-nucleotide adenylyltransferase [Flavobacteriales bacterium]|nr:nicotinate-nucleotide adenylyltransferase [Flavobacteriales bacterium]
MKKGLFFGSFNPIHKGHIQIATFFLDNAGLENIWFVVSPKNPLKDKKSLLDVAHRIELVNLALEFNPKMICSEIEMKLPIPSYTIDTLDFIKDKYPDQKFVIIMGTDNLESIDKWKDYNRILNEYQIYVYPRNGFDGGAFISYPTIKLFHSEFLDVSATELRKKIRQETADQWLPEKVASLIKEREFYM